MIKVSIMETVPTMEAMPTLVAMPTVVTVAKRQKHCCMERQHKTNISNEMINVINFFNIIQSIRDKYSWFQGDFYLVM